MFQERMAKIHGIAGRGAVFDRLKLRAQYSSSGTLPGLR
jgi:hypothetical protein